MPTSVRAWSETVTFPTYNIGEPNKNPMFLEKRVYQGSSGVIYPHPMIDRIYDEKEDRQWTAVFLENEWLKIMILPELGGRVQMALDKTNWYHFVYYNQVIKPALVGLCGPWISGGIELNWPQHHRPSTYSPVDWTIEENDDGSATIWCSEIERMFRTKGMCGFKLYPDRAFLELDVRLYNRTSEPQSFLWWANPGVSVSDDYQSVFPPDVHAVMDHGKRDVSEFPIATGEYYKVDYSPGTDITRYKNIPAPTSYMAYHSDYNFLGCYDHSKAAGMLHVANHHVVPGKKQWTWGNGSFGHAWDRQLTDEDGPYIELMCGAYTDNQPDFTWIMPGEEKRFKQTFMPYKDIGEAVNASREAVVSLTREGTFAEVGVYATRPGAYRVELWRDAPSSASLRNHKGMTLPKIGRTLSSQAETIFTQDIELSPKTSWSSTFSVPDEAADQELTVRILSSEDGRILLEYTPPPEEKPDIPEPAIAAKPPQEIESAEELFLNGLHLEQYRHATYRAAPYYEEALRRDPGDSRCNNALGMLLFRSGKFAEAETHFRAAIKRLTLRNPNPYDGEPYYNLGLALRLQGHYDEANDAFYKAIWNDAWQAAGYFELARLASRAGEWSEALQLIDESLAKNARHHKAIHLKAVCLRRCGRQDEAREVIAQALDCDSFNFGALWEQKLLGDESRFETLIRDNPSNYIEIALDYANAGLFEEAIELLDTAPKGDFMILYFAAWIQHANGNTDETLSLLNRASAQSQDFAFPHRIECGPALKLAIELSPQDALAPFALGNFLYSRRQYADAIAQWKNASGLDPSFPTVWRNLGLAYMNKERQAAKAQHAMENAFECDPSDSRVLFELDQLYKKLNHSPCSRLEKLDVHPELLEERDDLMIEYIALLNLNGRHQEAYDSLMKRNFHPWEGGEGKTSEQYASSLISLAKQRIQENDIEGAVERLKQAETLPENLGEGSLGSGRGNQIAFLLGQTYESHSYPETTHAYFEHATTGSTEPVAAAYYNDLPPDQVFYNGLAHIKLGREKEGRAILQRLIDYGEEHLDDETAIDYFAVSLPDFLVFDSDLNVKNQIHCRYMIGLGCLGLGDTERCREQLESVLALQADHSGAISHLGDPQFTEKPTS